MPGEALSTATQGESWIRHRPQPSGLCLGGGGEPGFRGAEGVPGGGKGAGVYRARGKEGGGGKKTRPRAAGLWWGGGGETQVQWSDVVPLGGKGAGCLQDQVPLSHTRS